MDRKASDLLSIIGAGIDAARPDRLFPSILSSPSAFPGLPEWVSAPDSERCLLCIGKAAAGSAASILPRFACRDSFVLAPAYSDVRSLASARVALGSHPIPDQRSLEATAELLAWLTALPADSRLLVVLSGGTSALLFAPLQGISAEAKMACHRLLIHSAASIREINTVRKHLSAVKGGQLSRSVVVPGRTVVLLISDVIGDDPGTIGSGPFCPDCTTFSDAKTILLKYSLWERVPAEIRRTVESGVAGAIPETPKPGGACSIPHHVIASNKTARLAAARKAEELGYPTIVAGEELSGSVETAADQIRQTIAGQRPGTAIVLGGEITLTIDAERPGTGGRNQHLALLLSPMLAGSGSLFAAAGTDGIDGNSNAAGAWTDGMTMEAARTAGVSMEKCLRTFDSFHFFERLGRTIQTGPTGTNVMDLYVALT